MDFFRWVSGIFLGLLAIWYVKYGLRALFN